MPRKSKVSDEDILELYRKGLTNRQIADALHMTQPAVVLPTGEAAAGE